MPYTPPSGAATNLLFTGAPPPLPNGGDLVLAFYLEATINTGQAQSAIINALGTPGAIGSANSSGQGSQSSYGVGVASVWVTTVQFLTGQGNQKTELIAVYQPPTGNNVIIDLGTGAYSAPVGGNVVIDLGDTVSITTYTKFLYFIIDTSFF